MEIASRSRLDAALQAATAALLTEMSPEGHWTGALSSSALSTATAVVALGTIDRQQGGNQHATLIAGGLRWLAARVNPDGGWGDTVLSKSNISTTALVWAAFGFVAGEFSEAESGAANWLRAAADGGNERNSDSFPVEALVDAIAHRYGKDRTFSVPILMTCALAGRLGPDGWSYVQPLPFELAALPQRLFGALRLPVVSYALPALIAIGQIIHIRAPTRNPVTLFLRGLTRRRTLDVLAAIQPENGGFLEAVPLTSFVTMSLAGMGVPDHPVARKGAEFLRRSVREDGSWPIDTNLATWVSTLSVKALSHQAGALIPEQRLTLRGWLLGQQYPAVHPYTGAAPYGWAWTNLPGGVPDADDTAGALLALASLGAVDPETRLAGLRGVEWLLDLQNGDGGIPTFCRGWGALPFDRSSPDLTGHALRAWCAWLPQLTGRARTRTLRAIARAVRFLANSQRADGSWVPLWFGNEHAPGEENPVYGSTQALLALRVLRDHGFALPGESMQRAESWLVRVQQPDGGWSGSANGPSSTEETGLAVEALAGTKHVHATDRGIGWLVARVESGEWRRPAPIGLYFAKLWYFERLYPLVFTVGALGKASALLRFQAP